MQSPSNSQYKAIKHGEGPMLVLAGPGSGKTFTIIQRILYLIREKHIPPENILVISFSKASAVELKQRFQKQINYQTDSINSTANVVNNKQVNFVTFHALFFQVLKEKYHYSTKDIIQEQEKREVLKIILTDPVYGESYSNEKAEEYLSKISYYKNRPKKELKEKEEEKFQKIYEHYNLEIHRRHKLDFDDMGLLCLKLWNTNTENLEKWRHSFEYILIDEFQDINEIQFLNIQLLVGEQENLYVVGDDDQAIYGFRGASPKYMLEFKQHYPKAETVLLETNFRCSETIVKQAQKVISKNKLRYEKEILASHKGGEPVIYKSFQNRQKEYTYIVEKIKEAWKHEGIKLQEIACIYRTNQDMTGLADAFIRNQIPFTMKEQSSNIFRHFIAKDILSYLQFFMEGKYRKDFIPIMNKPLRYISRNSLTREKIDWNILKGYYAQKEYMRERIEELEKNEAWINKLDLYGAIHYIRKVMRYEEYLKEAIKSKELMWEEAKEILDFVQESTRGEKNLESWKQRIREYEETLQNAKTNQEGVQLITMHSCKGLEFNTVFLPDCNEGKIPHKKAVSMEEVEEERRMFYVAMTRAKKHLELLYIEDNLKKHLQKSRFLK